MFDLFEFRVSRSKFDFDCDLLMHAHEVLSIIHTVLQGKMCRAYLDATEAFDVSIITILLM